MGQIRFVVAVILSVCAFQAGASQETSTRQTSLVVWLAPQDLENARLVVNASNRSRYTLQVENPEVIEAWLKNQLQPGLVRVEVEKRLAHDSVRILTIQPARTRRVPTYDSELVAVSRGNG